MKIHIEFESWEELQAFRCKNAAPEENQVLPAETPKEESPAITLQDIQKAVRELVKMKGKDTAKVVLERYGATGASSVKPENYKAVIADLKEALDA